MRHVKTIRAASHHYIAIFKTDTLGHPADPNKYTHRYVAKNFDADGVTFFYLAKGWHDGDQKAPNEIHVWYKNKRMWASCGTNFQTAIDGAQRDGWMYTD